MFLLVDSLDSSNSAYNHFHFFCPKGQFFILYQASAWVRHVCPSQHLWEHVLCQNHIMFLQQCKSTITFTWFWTYFFSYLFLLKWWQRQVFASLHYESKEQCATPAAVIVTAGEVSRVFLWLWNLYFSRMFELWDCTGVPLDGMVFVITWQKR